MYHSKTPLPIPPSSSSIHRIVADATTLHASVVNINENKNGKKWRKFWNDARSLYDNARQRNAVIWITTNRESINHWVFSAPLTLPLHFCSSVMVECTTARSQMKWPFFYDSKWGVLSLSIPIIVVDVVVVLHTKKLLLWCTHSLTPWLTDWQTLCVRDGQMESLKVIHQFVSLYLVNFVSDCKWIGVLISMPFAYATGLSRI